MMLRGMTTVLAAVLVCGLGACRLRDPAAPLGADDRYFDALASRLENTDPLTAELESSALPESLPPFTLENSVPTEYWDLTLHDVLQTALSHAEVLHDLGGTVIRSPEVVRTILDPAIQAADPRFGVQAALSAFDAIFSSNLRSENNDRAFNNQFFGGGTRTLKQDLFVWQSGITKRSVTGAEFTWRHNTDYDASNAPGNRFPSAWNTFYEAEARQPLLQGRGVLFNRIAGPGSQPGSFQGVLIARLNTDVELTELQGGLRDFVSDVENAYWELHFAYRNLESKVRARDATLETWRHIHALFVAGRRGGEAEKEAQARVQYYQFERDVENALSGQATDGTRVNNGSSGGTFRGTGGVLAAERKLRLLMGVPTTDGRLIRPIDEPVMARVLFDWHTAQAEALTRRAELRKQRLILRRDQMELWATRNFLAPRLDAVALYRWRGFGHDLTGSGPDRFDTAYDNLFGGDFQEWQLGLELNLPVGMRRAYSAVRNAQLRVARDQFLLRRQEQYAVNHLAESFAQLDRSYRVAQTSYNVRAAAGDELGAIGHAYQAGKAPLDQVLDAQRRLADSESAYFRSLMDYVVSVKNVHYEKGSLLEYNHVYLTENLQASAVDEDAHLQAQISRQLRSPFSYLVAPLQNRIAPERSDVSDAEEPTTPVNTLPSDSEQEDSIQRLPDAAAL